MTYQKIGPIEVITGENQSKVPFSTALFIRGKEKSALIDCGPGQTAFDYIKEDAPSDIYLTHYHLDHVWGVHQFPDAHVWINPLDKPKLRSLIEVSKANGTYAVYGKKRTEEWAKKQLQKHESTNHPLWKTIVELDAKTYPYDESLSIAGEKVIMLHAPGHSEGNTIPYFPEHGVLFVGDIDLSSFGPWYNNSDSDIDLFIESARKTLDMDAEYFVTAHHKGTFKREEYKRRLEHYLAIIDRREEKIINAIDRGVSPKDIVYEEAFYFKETHAKNSQHMVFEKLGIAKHLKRLIKNGKNLNDYYQEYIRVHNLLSQYIDYTSEPFLADQHKTNSKAHSR